jgi:alpha-tubulin suppressor-like RCC1 family protein
VSGLVDAVALSAGDRHTCALHKGGSVSCWGDGYSGQLGDGTSGMGAQKLAPSTVPNLAGTTQIAVSFYSTCALRDDGVVQCWGSNFFGQLGTGDTMDRSLPAPVQGLPKVASLAPGEVHICALGGDGAAYCWGSGGSGQLGNGSVDNLSIPTMVANLPVLEGIAAGGDHTCAWTTLGQAFCWGSNEFGQLGDGTMGGNKTMPVEVVW